MWVTAMLQWAVKRQKLKIWFQALQIVGESQQNADGTEWLSVCDFLSTILGPVTKKNVAAVKSFKPRKILWTAILWKFQQTSPAAGKIQVTKWWKLLNESD